jgi:hypothetical protein
MGKKKTADIAEMLNQDVLRRATAENSTNYSQDGDEINVNHHENSINRARPPIINRNTPQNSISNVIGYPSSSSTFTTNRALSLNSSLNSNSISSISTTGSCQVVPPKRTISRMKEEIARFLSITPHDSAVIIRYTIPNYSDRATILLFILTFFKGKS